MLISNSPEQSEPEAEGAGVLHCLLLVLVPPPHVELHSDHAVHADRPPSVAGEEKVRKTIFIFRFYNQSIVHNI